MLPKQLKINLPLQLEGWRETGLSQTILSCRPSSASRSVRMKVGQKTLCSGTYSVKLQDPLCGQTVGKKIFKMQGRKKKQSLSTSCTSYHSHSLTSGNISE